MRFPFTHPTPTDDNGTKQIDHTIERAERTIVAQERLTEYLESGQYDEFRRVATGNWLADLAADRQRNGRRPWASKTS